MFNRSWFRIHLSTALALTLVTGGLLWLNTAVDNRSLDPYESVSSDGFGELPPLVQGWPFHCRIWRVGFFSFAYYYYEWRILALLANILVAVALLALVAFVLEIFLRRRASPHS